jgi:pimeloyl-ACP methyl ester carboxylesterase
VLLIAYLILLAVSHLVRLSRPPSDAAGSGEMAALLRAVDGELQLDSQVRVVYDAYPAVDPGERSAVLLIHGSPGSKADFATVGPQLAGRYRVVVPDLPGFGRATLDVPDYSIRAHARYLLQLMDRLEIDRAHLVGFSMGGGVGLSLYELAPDRVRSLTLLSSIGVQELELFGSYRLNHQVHAAQLAVIWLAREALPHMGLLDDAFLGVPYARNFYDTDQRPLREILGRFRPPLLIVHGEDDFLVPPEAALEHHRIVPHSELQMLPASHFMVFLQGAATAGMIGGFIDRVESGEALWREQSPAERLALARQSFDPTSLPPFTGVALILVCAGIAAATLVSEDLTCIGVGLLVAQGRIDFLSGVIACFVGIYVGDLALYVAGRYLGRPALARAPLKWLIRPEHVEISSIWFNRRGPVVIVLSRFVPGTRLLRAVSATRADGADPARPVDSDRRSVRAAALLFPRTPFAGRPLAPPRGVGVLASLVVLSARVGLRLVARSEAPQPAAVHRRQPGDRRRWLHRRVEVRDPDRALRLRRVRRGVLSSS